MEAASCSEDLSKVGPTAFFTLNKIGVKPLHRKTFNLCCYHSTDINKRLEVIKVQIYQIK